MTEQATGKIDPKAQNWGADDSDDDEQNDIEDQDFDQKEIFNT